MLSKFIVPDNDYYQPFRIYEKKTECIKAGEHCLNHYKFPSLLASEYMEFFKNGNRVYFEELYFSKRSALVTLSIAEYMEKEGRFLPSIIDGIWSICEETTWVIPAHNNHYQEPQWEEQFHILGDLEAQPYFIDLFSAETASCLALTYSLLKIELDGVTPIIGRRIKKEVKQRVLVPYLSCDEFQWMGLGSHSNEPVNNWNPWIHSNYLTALLVIEDDTEKKKSGIEKALKSLSCFINGYGEDGGCDEGPNYWTAAGAALFDCLEILYEYSNGEIDVYSNPLIQNMGRYIKRVNISKNYFVNFGDGKTKLTPNGGLIYRYGKRIHDEDLAEFGLKMYNLEHKNNFVKPRFMIYRYIMDMAIPDKLTGLNHLYSVENHVYMEQLQLIVSKENGEKGLCLAAKGGHNGESHNHNDVGNYIIYYNGKPVIIDVGVGTYTAKTFGPQRYDIWTMQSNYHNLPIINGQGQLNGSVYKSSGVGYKPSPEKEEFWLSLKDAYPENAGLNHYFRTFEFLRNNPLGKLAEIMIKDTFAFKADKNSLTLIMMVCCEPSIEGDKIILYNEDHEKLVVYTDNANLHIHTEKIPIEDEILQGDWGAQLYRIMYCLETCEKEVSITFKII